MTRVYVWVCGCVGVWVCGWVAREQKGAKLFTQLRRYEGYTSSKLAQLIDQVGVAALDLTQQVMHFFNAWPRHPQDRPQVSSFRWVWRTLHAPLHTHAWTLCRAARCAFRVEMARGHRQPLWQPRRRLAHRRTMHWRRWQPATRTAPPAIHSPARLVRPCASWSWTRSLCRCVAGCVLSPSSP